MVYLLAAGITQDQALNSIRQTLGSRVDAMMLLWVAFVVLVVLGGLFYINRWANKRASSEGLNHPGKLVKEVSTAVGIKPAELKKLRLLMEQINQNGQNRVKNPMVLLLCPSVLAKAMKKK
jgi:hypothetical protein